MSMTKPSAALPICASLTPGASVMKLNIVMMSGEPPM
jgi:hypothetical protein